MPMLSRPTLLIRLGSHIKRYTVVHAPGKGMVHIDALLVPTFLVLTSPPAVLQIRQMIKAQVDSTK